jgi:DNA-binding transcriptional LysR family regulator
VEWQQLEYFRVVAKTEHFRHAAEQLNISQPALSRSITKLEEELGILLFDRMGRTVKLNKFGRLFLKRVENGLNEIAVGVQEINQAKNPFTGTVSIGFLQILGITILPDIVSDFYKQYPKVTIQLFQNKILDSIQQLLKREVDLSLITPVQGNSLITWQPLIDEELFLYVPASHPLAERSSVDLCELANENFIAFKQELGMHDVINGFCEQVGFTPNIKFEGEDVPTLAGLVSAGLGVTIIPPFHGIDSEKIKQISISKPYCHRKIGIAWLNGAELSPSVVLFRDHVIKRFSNE